MPCFFIHLPEEHSCFLLDNPPVILINSDSCPKQGQRVCGRSYCCLGNKTDCPENNCFNCHKIEELGHKKG